MSKYQIFWLDDADVAKLVADQHGGRVACWHRELTAQDGIGPLRVSVVTPDPVTHTSHVHTGAVDAQIEQKACESRWLLSSLPTHERDNGIGSLERLGRLEVAMIGLLRWADSMSTNPEVGRPVKDMREFMNLRSSEPAAEKLNYRYP